MSNIAILRKIQEIYNPKTAFGNSDILSLMGELVKPNKKGLFEVHGEVEKIIKWECVDCGRLHEEYEDVFDQVDGKLGRKCNCGAKHVIEYYE